MTHKTRYSILRASCSGAMVLGFHPKRRTGPGRALRPVHCAAEEAEQLISPPSFPHRAAQGMSARPGGSRPFGPRNLAIGDSTDQTERRKGQGGECPMITTSHPVRSGLQLKVHRAVESQKTCTKCNVRPSSSAKPKALNSDSSCSCAETPAFGPGKEAHTLPAANQGAVVVIARATTRPDKVAVFVGDAR